MKSILLLSLPLALADGSQKPIGDAWALPRGLNPALSDKYRPSSSSQTFNCLTQPQISLPISLLNDDFCDCPDGSDEPGTSACAHISSSVNPLPGFFCQNQGHVPAYIPFNRINDGICDYETCCDGSDEWMGVGGIKCPNRCEEIGKEARKAAEERRKLYESGIRSYNKLVEKAVFVKKEVEDKIVAVTGEIKRYEGLVEEKKAGLKKAEDEEKLKVDKLAAAGDEGKSRHQKLLDYSKDKLSEHQEKLSKLFDEAQRLKEELDKTEKILKTFKEEYNPNFNDEGVKRAVNSWEDYLAAKTTEDPLTGDYLAEVTGLMYESHRWEEYEPEDDDIAQDMYAIEAFLPPFLRTIVHEQLSSLRTSLVEYGLLAPRKPKQSTKSTGTVPPHIQKLTDDLTSTESNLSQKKSELTNLQNDLTKDYGPQSVFRSLKDVCTEAASGEYTYSFCHLGRATQKNREGGSTHLGDWTGFDRRYDDEIEQEVTVIKYEKGLRCWNGPERSAYVYLRCSAEEKILSVAETEKCVYKYVATSPAVCGDIAAEGQEGIVMGEAKRQVN
ncbi:hypothetical protein TWF102_010760 [Orbilia oligospora]|uniref:Glucosidase 2 subunit beta n=1 Tax=Orbilia oligospora TaxID=2813651 RepID=A0A7C8NUB7_ORBOL|nr:hypothetical protein TWF102_010760 [Orbilia oligospora]KAF3111531.1 hypothetical protein TWF103_003480 [Orbilia oligospora]KAF3136099.1 hypothetical protein TWF703_005744 [Orbilia oligospora]KAF3147924.1 hypothetical protein TWF594_001857 [Orbilia oligospora]